MNEVKKANRFGVEILFWIMIGIYSIPIFIYFYQKHVFSLAIYSRDFESGWKIYTSSFLDDVSSIPKDLKKIRILIKQTIYFTKKKSIKILFRHLRIPQLF